MFSFVKRSRVVVVAAFVCGAALASGAWLIRPAPAANLDASAYAKARVFEEALSLLRTHAVDSLNDGDLYVQATEGVIKSLHDPWAALLVGDNYDRFKARLDGTVTGIGLEVEARGSGVAVTGTLPDSPAERAGLVTGDRVLAVDDSAVEGWSVERTQAALRGPAGTIVRLAVERPGTDSLLVIAFTRGPVHEAAVRSQLMLGDGIGYLAVTSITTRAADELTRQIDALAAGGLHGLVIDLRGNPGGLVQEGARVAELFLNPGQIAATTQGREGEVFRARRTQRWPELPLAVLVDGGTASAAEVVAAAWQDHDRAIVVGTPTFGKGVVQRTYPLGDAAALRFTTARWYAPSGRWIQRGIPPAMVGHHSDGGRALPSGVGIVPDTTVPTVVPTEAERVYGAAAARDPSAYDDALAAIARHLVATGAVTSDTMAVTPRMRAMLYQRLQGSGLRVSGPLFTAAAREVDRDLGAAMVRMAFGSAAALRRRITTDRQVEAARALLLEHPSARAVLALERRAGGARSN